MTISVVICTRNRPETIGQAVESVVRCSYPDFDIHVMDQSTSDATERIVEELTARHRDGCRIEYHHLEKAGLSRAYNAGMDLSRGEIIAFTDDDCVVPENWLTEIARSFRDDPQAGLLYGQVRIPEELKPHLAPGSVVPCLVFGRRERLCKGRRFKVFGMGANMAIRRTLLGLIGGFDEALGGGGALRSSQDFDFAYRTFLSGQAILLAPEVVADHYGVRTSEQWPSTLEAYGIGDGGFYGKHIRCGDLRAFWLFSKMLLRSGARGLRQSLRDRRWSGDVYGRNLFVGLRLGKQFRIDKRYRLYQETMNAKMVVTQANQVTAVSSKPS